MAWRGDEKDSYRWTGTPPPRGRTEIPLLRVKAGRSYKAVVVSDKVEGLLVHFLAGRTKACLGSEEACDGCRQGWRPRWKGYLAVYFPSEPKRVYLAELTPKAFEALTRSAVGLETYRGLWIQVERAAGRPNAQLKATVIAVEPFAGVLPDEPNIREAVSYILEAPDRKACDPKVDPSSN